MVFPRCRIGRRTVWQLPHNSERMMLRSCAGSIPSAFFMDFGFGSWNGPGQAAGRADEEIAGERPGKSAQIRIERGLALVHALVLRVVAIFCSVLAAEHHAVAGGAGNAVARERPVPCKLGNR